MADDIKQINDEINRLRAELGRRPLKPFEQADLEAAKATLTGIRAQIREMSSDLDYVAKSLKDGVNELSNQKTYLSDARKAFSSISSISEKILDYRRGETTLSEKQLKDLQTQAKKRYEQLELIKNVGNLSQANRLEVIQALNDQEKFNESVERTIKHQKDVNKEIGLVGTGINGIAKAASKLGFGDLSQPLTEAIEKTKNTRLQMKLNSDQISEVNKQLTQQNARQLSAAQLRAGFGGKALKDLQLQRDALEEQNAELSTQTSKYKNIGNALKEQFTKANLIDFAIKEFVDALISGDKATGELAKGFNMSYEAASNLRSTLNDVANLSADVNVSTKGLQESMMAVGKTLGSNAVLNEKDLLTFTKLREQSGMSNENLASMQRFTLATGGTLEDNTAEFLAQAQITAQNNGVVLNTKQLLEETANVSDAIKLSAGGTATGFAKAAAQVKSLGMSLEQADNIANSLLQFEDSITSELEAELLVGKDLTLEKARQAALNGDLVTVAKEISDQIGSSAEFTKMNRLQQEALAKSVGMSRDDLAKTLVEREALVGLSAEEAKAGKETFDNLVKQYGVEKAQQMIKEQGFETLMKQQSIQERFGKSVEKLREVFISLAQPVLDILDPLMEIVNEVLPLINLALAPAVVALKSVGKIISTFIREPLEAVKSIFSGIASILQGDFEQGFTKIGKGLVKALLTPITAIISGFDSLINGAIGIINKIPGVDLGAVDLASGWKSMVSINDGVISPDGGLVVAGEKGTYSLNANDTVVAGTNLGRENGGRSAGIDIGPLVAEMQNVKAVLQQILAKEGAVYIDSTKAGTAFAVGTSKLQ